MTPERWQKVKSILEEAIEVAPAARFSFLEKACAGDTSLRREVESLLDYNDTKSDVLEQNAFSAMFYGDEAVHDFTGRQIGKYRVAGELGEGGMGAVFLAERADGEFEQKVALKLIKRGMDSAAVLRRFINERQILAALEHPNIARLIDGGTTDDGLPFFVMEFVEGETITDFAERGGLDLEARLKLFREVCAAVSFAHQNLVIHRDLKPSNILVTRDGKVKLLDFGIAKLLRDDPDGETATKNYVFTPEYASPEQIRGEKLTTATDVFSLGVILYELLTGRRPYRTESKSIGEIIRAVCETEPIAPSRALNDERGMMNDESKTENEKSVHRSSFIAHHSLRGDLDNIILKALRKEPERRYSSVEQLTEDIRRHQEGLPVSASRGTWKYRAAKFVRRNRIGVAASGLILLTLLAGLGATLYQANVARVEREKAERRYSDVRQMANSFLFEFHDAIKSLSGSTPARKLVVSRALEYLDRLAAESSGDAAVQRELATAYEKIGQIQGNSYHSNLGDTDGALKSYERSLEIRQKLVAADPENVGLRHELADSHEGVGDMFYTVSELRKGLESYETAVGIREKIVAERPDDLEYRYALAGVLGKRGDISGMEGFPNLGDVPKALESYRRGVGLFEELVKAAPENEKYQSGYAIMLYYFGMLQTISGDAAGAIRNGEKSVEILERLIAAHPDNAKYETDLMSALVFMRFPLLDEGRTEEAVRNARRVVRRMEKMSAQDPKNAFMKRSLSVSYNSLGICLRQSGDARGAVEMHQRSLAISKELAAADPSSSQNTDDISKTRQFLAQAQTAAGDEVAALANLREAVAFLETRLAGGSPQKKEELASSLVELGKILAAQNDLRAAADAFRRAAPLAEASLQNSPHNMRVKARQANSFFEAGRAIYRLGEREPGANRAAIRKEACGYLERSVILWSELRRDGALSAVESTRPELAAKEWAVCVVQ